MTSENKPIDSDNVGVNRRIIQSDRIKRLKILNHLWKIKRKGENRGQTSSDKIMQMLGVEDYNEVLFHLATLKDHGLIKGQKIPTGDYVFIEILGGGTTTIEDFFLEMDKQIRNSKNTELQNQIQKIDLEDDLYVKHDMFITIMQTIQSGFEFGNRILKGLGIN